MQRQIGNLEAARNHQSINFVQSIPTDLSMEGNTPIRLICLTTLSATVSRQFSMQNRTIQPGNRQLSLNIKQQSPLLVSSIFSYSSSFQKSRPGSDGNDIASHNNLPVTILVPTFNENASSSTITSS